MTDERLARWHKVVFEKDLTLLHELLDENVEFHSPTVWSPKQGREITAYILAMVIDIFQSFEYHREWLNPNDFALEFSATVGDKKVKGIDLIRWNEAGKIIHFEVMMRPINGLNSLFEKMTERLHSAGFIS
ncbi:nuclear transport factor 2 family protein [Aestuariicella hydrocarbonica]|uniref:Nuclear transport factor 2 family protein n=1 Tax=Pseudomaricurvus hydrocarbonicus TaxID=1470433 RepID=A0A9E5JS16_9GAMM|nr:nuclear transport factor 2 family protein [Aestuariicella hydrocarbonica]NHO65489.1 nuclear transport factor 2 family protein [Aestuariicella hydrocarbonica]